MTRPARRRLATRARASRAPVALAGALLRGLLTAVFPPSCAACARLGRSPFCALCQDDLEPAPPFAIDGAEAARALFLYGGPVQAALHRLKYRAAPELGPRLGVLLAPVLAELAREAPLDAVVPMPLSPERLADRGYNQARELIRPLALPARPRALVRRDAPEQVGLGKMERLENLRGAIRPGPQPVRGASILLVDDVVTTGATAAAAIAALRESGARRVVLLALARTSERTSRSARSGTEDPLES